MHPPIRGGGITIPAASLVPSAGIVSSTDTLECRRSPVSK